MKTSLPSSAHPQDTGVYSLEPLPASSVREALGTVGRHAIVGSALAMPIKELGNAIEGKESIIGPFRGKRWNRRGLVAAGVTGAAAGVAFPFKMRATAEKKHVAIQPAPQTVLHPENSIGSLKIAVALFHK